MTTWPTKIQKDGLSLLNKGLKYFNGTAMSVATAQTESVGNRLLWLLTTSYQ